MSKAVHEASEQPFALPPSLTGRPDVARLLREVEAVDYELETQAIREPNKPLAIPNMSKALTETIQINRINLTDANSRKQLVKLLREVKEKAPIVHVTFAVDADPAIIAYMVTWFRQKLHPTVLVTVGLQPRIVGGCIVRTPDHIYDFSLRRQFQNQQSWLAEQIRAVAGA